MFKMPKKLLFPEDVRALVGKRYRSQHRDWLVLPGSWPLSLSLSSLTERDVQSDAPSVREWVEAWVNWDGAGTINWSEMQWPRIGPQRIPARLNLMSANEVAQVVSDSERFERAQTRYRECAARWPRLLGSTVVGRHFDVFADYAEAEYRRLFDLLTWLCENPSSGKFLRQLPVHGLHTKWIESGRRGVVSDLLDAILEQPRPGNFYDKCGLCQPPHRARLRILCPQLRSLVGGLSDVEAPMIEVAQMPLTPSRAIVIENLETGLALPDIHGCVAFLRLGGAVSTLGQVRWLGDAALFYWGDVDTHGFAILDRARATLGKVTSLLMDEPTLLAHRNLWVEEPVQHPDVELLNLTSQERAVFQKLRSNFWGRHVRLEQERLPWSMAVAAIVDACAADVEQR